MTERGPGYKRFLLVLEKMKQDGLPETARKFARINEGYRRMLYRQAGLTADDAEKSLAALSAADCRKLFDVNQKIAHLAAVANAILAAAVMPRR
ncbi:MAG: hypothetical protein IPP18_18000 [Rhodocyclaceae bacterium]|jgi:hypothetical protein|nr:hypothetical protein [Rhodocyclaceae bacterium]MBK9311744.1 hypothetical protein [Rhodocyclaceae bacterium]MBK9956900.1 hypothetical protein [Rhodocyclaceae bacterium]